MSPMPKGWVRVMVLNATISNISAISWRRRSINQQMSLIMIKTKVFLVGPYSACGVVYSIQHYGIKCDL
jgi:hypothetical protein